MKRAITLAAFLVIMFLAVTFGAQLKPTDERVPCRDYKDVFALFDRLGYTQKAWQAGIREVPRVYLEDIPDRWREKGSKDMPVADKKRLFFRLIAPIVLRINELIAADRARAKVITEKLLIGEGVTPEDQAWLTELAVQYKVIGSPDDRLDSDQYPELLLRVDIVPASLSLAQAASESGWGTSRFAAEGNSLFGQWSWGKGLKPTEQRAEEIGDHRVAAFGSTGEAAYAYARNLNTQDAYRDFRLRRSELRRRNLLVSGEVLVETLIRYSERGQAYVEDIKRIIRQNRLADTDDAYLRDMPVIRIVDAYAQSK
ncbi:MAG TPA: glucosaminidase domain-containing protein [Thermoanaerobaculaceae bacterium]|nr:glucosaminidase domain-containing protein [Thermoanaerobaculaceae bacterium]